MKTFDEIARKLFAQDSEGDSEFVVPECWKPKTIFQASFLGFANMSTAGNYSEALKAALGQCLDDFANQHMIPRTEILFDGNLNFTITVGESSATATSNNFSLATEVHMRNANIAVDGENLPSAQSESYTGMTARLMSAESVNPDVHSYFVRLSNLANTFASGEHHVVISITAFSFDLEPKTYKELVFADEKISPIVENKMLPKTPEELAFALLKGLPVEFSDASHEPAIEPPIISH